ncbi:hypothetical protein MF406_04055 [Georgenia sp. TF02-10]|uniref:hypothetical protein n=1 Tax=Georgenia sp. TF02-10 TaxID=2917725 RepID=UPI001FA7EE03|nr:hypothetical protein [Georgenia sp. TF02-10]UNX55448.1 hypothetical protein MF406_04055 [Georgenia sp. TF02-10]
MVRGRGARRRHRRVVALSEVDRRRLDSGEIASAEEALHGGDAAPDERDAPAAARGPNDDRLLRDVPPHWGRR